MRGLKPCVVSRLSESRLYVRRMALLEATNHWNAINIMSRPVSLFLT